MRTSYGVGRYQASEADVLAGPQIAVASNTKRGCLFFAGHTSKADSFLTSWDYGQGIVKELVDIGIPVLSADWGGGTTFGNATAQARAETGRVYQQTAQGVKTDKILVAGISMGSVTAMRYAMANPTLVAALALFVPVPDLQGFYDANIGGLAAEVSAAYGGRPSNGQNPSSNPSSFTGIPTRIWYSTNDATALPTPIVTFAAAIGATLTSLGAIGHSLSSLKAREVAEFLTTYST